MYTSYIDYFENTVNKYGAKTAVVDQDMKYSFLQIANNSKIIASAIIEATGAERNRPVAVYLPKSANTVMSDIGILYSSHIFMNLDVKTPLERIEAIISHVKPMVIITDADRKTQLSDIIKKCDCPLKVLQIEEILQQGVFDVEKGQVIQERLALQIDTDPSCIINTSGSTGVPKGVILNHKSFFDFLDWSITTFDLDETANMGSLSPSVFDIFVYELWLMAGKGATITLLNENMSMFPAKLLEQMKREKVNFIFWVPSIMVNIANMDLLKKIELNDLRLVWFAGEVFPTKQFNYWRKALPHTKFANLYGPIEITLDCTYYIIEREFEDSEPLPIGYPCKNTDILILDVEDQLCKPGEEGELCVRGTSLAMGYYKNPDKTAIAFTQNPLNQDYPELIYRTGDIVYVNEHGEIAFKGRKDSLIKHMGYRIELGEIEHAIINKLKIVEYCCVVYNKQKKEITLIYESEKDIDMAIFRKELLSLFPKYMIPVKYIRKELLPRNTNGKIDRNKLSEEVNCNG